MMRYYHGYQSLDWHGRGRVTAMEMGCFHKLALLIKWRGELRWLRHVKDDVSAIRSALVPNAPEAICAAHVRDI